MEPEYVPNRLPTSELVINVLYAVVILGFGALGLFKGELMLPGKRTGGAGGASGAALTGPAAWVMAAAMACAVCVLLSSLADHFDRRNNEAGYRRFTRVGKVCGWSLFALALALHAFRSWGGQPA